MPATPEQLEQQIAMTRHELAATLSEIEERANPKAIIRRNRPRLVMVGMSAVGLVVTLLAVRVTLKHVLQ